MSYNYPRRSDWQLHISEPADPNPRHWSGDVEPHGMCICPGARHDDRECPTCRRPSFSAERIAEFQRRSA